MKRERSEDPWNGIKKLKCLVPKACFPDIKPPFIQINFSYFISGHHDDANIIFRNAKGGVGFHTHKQILKALSPFWKNLLEADLSIKALEIEEICNETVELVQYTIENHELPRIHVQQWKNSIKQNACILKDMMFLVNKHDLLLMKEILQSSNFHQDKLFLDTIPLNVLHNAFCQAKKLELSNLVRGIQKHMKQRFWTAVGEDFQYYSKEWAREQLADTAKELESGNLWRFEEKIDQCIRYAVYQLSKHDESFWDIIENLKVSSDADRYEIRVIQMKAFRKVLKETAVLHAEKTG